jgi:hypothetical protein
MHLIKHGMSFPWCEHDRNFCRTFDPLHVVDEIEFAIEHLLVEKKQRGESLVLSRGGNVFLGGQMSQECGDFRFAHFFWMAFAVKENKAPAPIDVGLLGADAVMLQAQLPADAVE